MLYSSPPCIVVFLDGPPRHCNKSVHFLPCQPFIYFPIAAAAAAAASGPLFNIPHCPAISCIRNIQHYKYILLANMNSWQSPAKKKNLDLLWRHEILVEARNTDLNVAVLQSNDIQEVNKSSKCSFLLSRK